MLHCRLSWTPACDSISVLRDKALTSRKNMKAAAKPQTSTIPLLHLSKR